MAVTREGERAHDFPAAQIVAKLVSREFGGSLDGMPLIDEDLARQVIQTAQRNKLLKPVLKELEALGVKVPADLESEIALYQRKAMTRTAAAIATLREASGQLAEAGVTHAVFKGPVRQIAAGRDLFERPVADVDILVKSEDFARATSALVKLGYYVPHVCDSPWWRHYLGEHTLFPDKRGRCHIDLHHRVQQPSCPRPRNEQAAMLDDPQWVDVSGQKIQTFGPNAVFLHTVMSVIKGLMNHEPTGRYVVDLGRQLSSANPEQLAEFERIAKAQRLEKSYAVARRAAFVVTGVEAGPTPPWIAPDEKLVAMLLTPSDPKIRWPARRNMLWHLVDGPSATARAANFSREFAWWAASEFTRRTHDVSDERTGGTVK
jgi:hypothetical protein